jgi:hypothetical protein
MKLVTKILVALTIGTQLLGASVAKAAVGGDSGNGGGGVLQNGQYMTFFSAGLTVNPVAKGLETSPALNQLVRFISASPYLATTTKAYLLKAILPAQNRNYFDVRADKFGADVQQRLKEEYQRATSASASQIVLYAVTDTNSKNTYLLPNFYRLSPTGQMAILFHEAMWVLHPDSSYSQIINAEATFQAHVEQPKDFTNAQRFVRLVGGIGDEARFAYTWDRANGVITADGRVIEGSNSMVLSLANLFGKGSLSLDRHAEAFLRRLRDTETAVQIQTQAVNLSLAFPHSKFLEFYRDAAMSDLIYLETVSNTDGLKRLGLDSGWVYSGILLSQTTSPLRLDESTGAFVVQVTRDLEYRVLDKYQNLKGYKTQKGTLSGVLSFQKKN